jgi:hypothetical protein
MTEKSLSISEELRAKPLVEVSEIIDGCTRCTKPGGSKRESFKPLDPVTKCSFQGCPKVQVMTYQYVLSFSASLTLLPDGMRFRISAARLG